MIDKRPPPMRAGTSDELRKDIDSGATGDKVPYSDPAAAPLGADDEAGGHPPTRDQIAAARAQESAPTVPHPNADEGPRVQPHGRDGNPIAWIAVALAVLVVAAIAIAAMFTW